MSKLHWLALASTSGIGGATARKLIERFGDIESVFDASDAELLEIPRVTGPIVENLRAVSLDPLEQELYALAQDDIDLLTWDDPRFPQSLRALPDAPLILFIRGAFKREDNHALAIVGTREPSNAAMELAATLARELAVPWTDRGQRSRSGH